MEQIGDSVGNTLLDEAKLVKHTSFSTAQKTQKTQKTQLIPFLGDSWKHGMPSFSVTTTQYGEQGRVRC